MKNLIKLPFFALAISLSLAACKGNNSGGASDSTKVDSSTSTKTTIKADTTANKDTSKMSMDTTKKKDTVKIKTTEVKKKETKKD